MHDARQTTFPRVAVATLNRLNMLLCGCLFVFNYLFSILMRATLALPPTPHIEYSSLLTTPFCELPRPGAVPRVESYRHCSENNYNQSAYLARPLQLSVHFLFSLRACASLEARSVDPFTREAPSWEDDGSGAAAISDKHRGRGGYFARASLRQQVAVGTAARAGSGSQH